MILSRIFFIILNISNFIYLFYEIDNKFSLIHKSFWVIIRKKKNKLLLENENYILKINQHCAFVSMNVGRN